MKKIQVITSLGIILSLIAILVGPFWQVANAAAISSASDIMSRLKVSVLSNHEIKFVTPTGVDVSTDTITVTFPAGFAMGTFALLNFDLGATAAAAGCAGTFTEKTGLAAAAAAGIWGVAQSAQVVTFTAPTDAAAGNIAANACVRIRIGSNAVTDGAGANQITNPSTAGGYAIGIAGAFGDSGNITVQILTDEQVAVSATVGQTLSFSISTASLALGTLSVTTAVTGSHTIALATNGITGMVVTYSGATLTSGANTVTACATACTSTVGSEQFGINAVANTAPAVGAACSGTAPIAAAATGYATANSFLFVSGQTIVSSTAPINTTTCTISYLTNIAGTSEAGSYTSTLTFVATATF